MPYVFSSSITKLYFCLIQSIPVFPSTRPSSASAYTQRHHCQIQESHEIVYPRLGDIPVHQRSRCQEPSFKQILPLQLRISINMPRHHKTVIILEYIILFQDGHKRVIQVFGKIKFVIRLDRIVIRTCPIDCQSIKATINVQFYRIANNNRYTVLIF